MIEPIKYGNGVVYCVMVRCDRDGCKEARRTEPCSERRALQRATAAGWSIKEKHLCPGCSRVPCHDCGALVIPGGEGGHRKGAHHRALVLCTEMAADGYAPLPPSLRAHINSDALCPSKVSYSHLDTHRRAKWSRLEFVEIANLEEIEDAHRFAALLIRAVRAVRADMRPWWHAWAATVGIDIDSAARRTGVEGRGHPWLSFDATAAFPPVVVPGAAAQGWLL